MAGVGSAPGVRYGGRKKGSLSKPRAELEAMLREKFGSKYDPVVEAADIEQGLKQEIAELKQQIADGELVSDDATKATAYIERATDTRLRALVTVSRYTRPQLKQVEVSGPDKGPIQIETSDAAIDELDRILGNDSSAST